MEFRYLVVERVMDYNDYVFNNCWLDNEIFIYLIIGLNMFGKLIYMR